MRYLIVSDLHSNWEALDAVLQVTAGRYDAVLCCGDLVGYGADPNAITDWARANVVAVVRGNHDRASVGLEDLEWFNASARAAALWTERQLTPENAAYIRALPRGPLPVASFEIVHGSPMDEDEYLADSFEATAAFQYVNALLVFFGHTHLQGGFIWRRHGVEVVSNPAWQGGTGPLRIEPEVPYLLNPGSVGQPRDNDPRAACLVYDSAEALVTFYRLEYDLAKAQDKIRRAGLPAVLADRLAVGR